MFGYDWPRLHAALNDLPAALLIVAVLFELLFLTTRRDSFRVVSYWTLIVGAVGGAAAVLSGLQAEEHIAHGDAVHKVMETHELLAFITLGIFGVLAVWRLWRESRMGTMERRLAVALAVAGAGVLFATSNYGGKLVFDHAAGIPTEVLNSEIRNRSEGHTHGEGEEPGEAEHDDDHAPAAGTTSRTDSAGATADSGAAAGHVDPPGTPAHEH